MSFLNSLAGPLAGNVGAGMRQMAPAVPQANAAATGLGKLIGVDGAKISSIADSVGKGMNMIAQGGGAQGGYAAPPPAVNNHMQLLDPKVLQALIQHFGGGGVR